MYSGEDFQRRVIMASDSILTEQASLIEEVVRTHVGSATPISLEASLADDLDIDSLELVELSLSLEKQFGVEFPSEDIRACNTLGDIIQVVSRTTQKHSQEKVQQA
jgi:acyl carrier protein